MIKLLWFLAMLLLLPLLDSNSKRQIITKETRRGCSKGPYYLLFVDGDSTTFRCVVVCCCSKKLMMSTTTVITNAVGEEAVFC